MRSLPSDKVLVDVLRSMLEGSYIRRDLLELDNLVLEGDLTPHLVLTRLWLPTCRCLRLLYLVLQPTNIRVIHEHLKGSIPTVSAEQIFFGGKYVVDTYFWYVNMRCSAQQIHVYGTRDR